MKLMRVLMLLIAITLVLPICVWAWEGKVVQVVAGDHLRVLKSETPVDVILAAVDCPEPGQPYAETARAFVADLANGKRVTVWALGKDAHGSVIAQVFTDKVNLSKALLQAGLAWHIRQHPVDMTHTTLEMSARAAQKGLWRQPHPVPPWEYRRSKHQGRP